jgi:flagellar assembly factor FliW
MPEFETSSLGRIFYEPEWAIEFPSGLPGFEDRRRFAAIKF